MADLGYKRAQCLRSELVGVKFQDLEVEGDGPTLPEPDAEPQLWTRSTELGRNLGEFDLGSNNDILRARRIGVKYGQVEVKNIDSVD